MIIGATGESDYQIMSVTEALYRKFEMKRVFYSAFINVNDKTNEGLEYIGKNIFTVQFHPEAVLTEYGHELLRNYTKICREWWSTYENSDSQIVLL